MTLSRSLPRRLRDESAIRFAEADVVVVLVLFGCAGLHASAAVAETVVLLVVLLHAGRLPTWLGVALGAVAWAFVTGFVVHDFGLLTFRQPDLARLFVAVLAGGTAALAGPRPRAATVSG